MLTFCPDRRGCQLADGSIFDITKFVMSILIVCIHSNQMPDFLNPILRIAVPLFFIMTSYFFWRKNIKLSKSESICHLKQFAKRNLFLFIFWTIVLSYPISLFNGISGEGIIGYIRFFRNLFFCDTFKGSWFIMASVQAITIVFFLARKLKNGYIFAISILFYLICMMTSNYNGFYGENLFIRHFSTFLHHTVGEAHLSYMVAMIWVSAGKIFAEYETVFFESKNYINRLFYISLMCLYCEYAVIYTKFGRIPSNDCYFFLLPVCLSLFALILSKNVYSFSFHIWLRRFSTVIYCLHGTLLVTFSNISSINLYKVPLAILCCSLLTLLLVKLSGFEKLKFLKYSY